MLLTIPANLHTSYQKLLQHANGRTKFIVLESQFKALGVLADLIKVCLESQGYAKMLDYSMGKWEVTIPQDSQVVGPGGVLTSIDQPTNQSALLTGDVRVDDVEIAQAFNILLRESSEDRTIANPGSVLVRYQLDPRLVQDLIELRLIKKGARGDRGKTVYELADVNVFRNDAVEPDEPLVTRSEPIPPQSLTDQPQPPTRSHQMSKSGTRRDSQAVIDLAKEKLGTVPAKGLSGAPSNLMSAGLNSYNIKMLQKRGYLVQGNRDPNTKGAYFWDWNPDGNGNATTATAAPARAKPGRKPGAKHAKPTARKRGRPRKAVPTSAPTTPEPTAPEPVINPDRLRRAVLKTMFPKGEVPPAETCVTLARIFENLVQPFKNLGTIEALAEVIPAKSFADVCEELREIFAGASTTNEPLRMLLPELIRIQTS